MMLFSLLACLQFHQEALEGRPENYAYSTIRDTHIRYDVQGSGPTVVMIHGFASSLGVWEQMMPTLTKNYRVIRMDLKGFGWSSRPKGDYSPQEQSAIVWKLLEEIGVDDFMLVAHSWGSSVALNMALEQPKRIHKIALYDAWVYDEQLTSFFIWARNPGFGETLFTMWYKERADDRMSAAFYDVDRYVTQEFVDHVYSVLDRPGTVAAALEAVRGQHYETIQHRYKDINIPTLLLWGKQDNVTPLWVGEKLASELPQSQLKTYGSCGHFPMIEAYGPSTHALLTFLKEGQP